MGRTAALLLAVAGCAALSFGPDGRCEEGAADEIQRLLDELVSGDAARQKAATKRLRLRGPAVALDLLRPALRSAGGPGEQAIVDAIATVGVEECLAHLYAHQTAWPGNRRGVEDFLARVRERRAPGLSRSVRLGAAPLDQPRRLPPSVEHRVTDSVPAQLAGADLRATEVDGKLQIDTRGDGRSVSAVDPGVPKAVDLGPPPGRKVIVHRRVGAWFAGPASLLAGKLDGESVELLDADLDGSFDGPQDLISVGGAPFQRRRDAAFIHTVGGTATHRLTNVRGVATLEVTPEPVLQGVDPALRRTVAALGAPRYGLGVGYSIGSCLWGGTMRADDLPGPILVPGPGQRRVPGRCESEIPTPTRDPEFYAVRRGYPVTVGYEGLWSVVTDARIDLWPADAAGAPPLDGETFSREAPYLDGDTREPTTTFVPRARLRAGTWYHARFTAVADGKPVAIEWSFETE